MPDGHDTYRTFLGSILSVITLVIMLAYGSYKVSMLAQLEDYDVQLRTLENEFHAGDTFGTKQEFAVAAALVSFDGQSFNITDPTIG